MSRRKKIIIIIIAVILGILAIVILLLSLGPRAPLFNRAVNEPPVVAGNIPARGNLNAALNVNAAPSTLTAESSTQSTLIATALTFAERFGSFSSESNFENLADLKVMMTDKMKSWTDNYIAKNQGQAVEFYGITTRAINAEIITLADGDSRAQVLVSTQREETKQDAARAGVYYQKILLNLVRQDGRWKVDSATWQ